jgi:hypothetical protein
VRCGDDGFEESIGPEDWRFAPEAVVEDNIEDSVLWSVRKLCMYKR